MNRICATCKIDKDILNFHKSGLKPNGEQKYKHHCKECRTSNEREYKCKYRAENKDSIRDYNRKYEVDRKLIDEVFRFKRSVRTLLCRSFRYVGKKTGTSTELMLGCSILEFHSHIESLFSPGMNWENRNLWDIDHIKPLSTAKTIEDVIKLNHHTNLQPLWTGDNIRKKQTDRKKWN